MKETQLHILLVEDDEVDVMGIRRILARDDLDITLHVAWNGLEALRRLRNDGGEAPIPPDRRLVLLDLNMPLLGGIQFLRQLRRDPELRQTPVIVLTTSAEEGDRSQANQLDVAGYVVKPVSARVLHRMVAAFAPGRHSPIDCNGLPHECVNESLARAWRADPPGVE